MKEFNRDLPITYNQAEELFDRKFDEAFDRKFAHYFDIMREDFIGQMKMMIEASEMRLERKIDLLVNRIDSLERKVLV